jgi:hypothetical protein
MNNPLPVPKVGQSRLVSFLEALTNVVVGYLLAVLLQMIAFPMFGLAVSVTDNLAIGALFSAVSLVRSFALRRLFETVRSYAAGPRPFRASTAPDRQRGGRSLPMPRQGSGTPNSR